MNNQIEKDVQKLRPFTKFCGSIGAIPTSYLVSMTYEEQLIWLCNYLEKTVIPTVNANGEAVEELQELFVELREYVNNYLETALQTDVDNKLDEMAESGQLDDIVGRYIDNKLARSFKSLQDLISTDLEVNFKARTLGYYEENDGGGAWYYIRNDIPEGKIYETLENGNYAELIVDDKVLNALQCGAKGDGITDNVDVITKMMEHINDYTLYFPKGNYLTSPVPIATATGNVKIYGDNANFKLKDNTVTSDNKRIFSINFANSIKSIVEISGLNIDMNFTHNKSVIDSTGNVWALQHCHAIFIYGNGQSEIDVIAHDLTFNDLIADGISLGGNASLTIDSAIINNVISKNRTATRSDIVITCDFNNLSCSDMVLDKFEIEINATRSGVRRSINLNNIDCKNTIDLDINDESGDTVLYANNCKTDSKFYSDIHRAYYNNCTFNLDNFVRLNGDILKFTNCNFFVNNPDNFITYSANNHSYFYASDTAEMDITFENCKIDYSNTILTNDSIEAYFIYTIIMKQIKFINCDIDISSKFAYARGGDFIVQGNKINCKDDSNLEMIRYGSLNKNVKCYLLNNRTDNENLSLIIPPAGTGSNRTITIFENNPEWILGRVFAFTRFDKITSFNGGNGSIVTIKELTEFLNNEVPTSGQWILGQIVKSSLGTAKYFRCTRSGSFDSGTAPTFETIN